MTELESPSTVVERRRLAVAADAAIEVVDLRAPVPGPSLAVLAGIHGDEPEGTLAVLRLVEALPALLESGTVRAVAVGNPCAFRADLRESPVDGANLARCFPGRRDGTPTERLASLLHEHVITPATFVIDLHSAGRDYAMPLFCGFRAPEDADEPDAEAAARAFGAPLAWRHTGPVAGGRTTSSAFALGIPSLYAEAEGGQEVRARSLEAFVAGTLRVARHLGMTASAPSGRPTETLIDGGGGDIDRSLRAPADGYLVTRCAAGDIVESGDVLAELLDERGRPQHALTAPRRGAVMLLRRKARIRRGEAVAFVAHEPSAWPARA